RCEARNNLRARASKPPTVFIQPNASLDISRVALHKRIKKQGPRVNLALPVALRLTSAVNVGADFGSAGGQFFAAPPLLIDPSERNETKGGHPNVSQHQGGERSSDKAVHGEPAGKSGHSVRAVHSAR